MKNKDNLEEGIQQYFDQNDGKIKTIVHPSRTSTKQVKKKATLKNNNPINEKAQFGKPNGNPRHNGAWKKEDTLRFKLRELAKLKDADLTLILNDDDSPRFERNVAKIFLDQKPESKDKWKMLEGLINQVEGTPKQSVDMTSGGEKITGVNISFGKEDDDGNKH